MIKILIGILVLLFGVVLGNYLAKNTKEELKSGQVWFRLIIIVSLVGGFAGLWSNSDAIMFSLFFVAIVTSRSLRK